MICKEKKDIVFINDCNAIVDEKLLRSAICWYSSKPLFVSSSIFICMAIIQPKIITNRVRNYKCWDRGFRLDEFFDIAPAEDWTKSLIKVGEK